MENFPKRLEQLINGHQHIPFIAKKTGVAKKTIYSWLRGDSLPRMDSIALLCVYFDVSADYLIFGKEEVTE